MQKLISIIVPVYNEEKSVSLVYNALLGVMKGLSSGYDFEIIFINDGSTDQSGQSIEALTKTDRRIKYIEFSRNFGKERATSAGIHHAKGDAAIMIDADMQHPPKLIPEFIKKWEKGADIVIGVRERDKNEGFVRKYGALCFYKTINAIGETKIIPNATDFRLIDKKVINEFKQFTERNRMTRGLLDWMGFKKDYITFRAEERISGSARYSTLKLIKLALSTIVSHSLFPLKFAGYLGIFIIFTSGPLGLFMLIDKYLINDPFGLNFTGTAALAVVILFMMGIVLSCLGLMALYIANIHNEVTNRPLYIIRKTENLEDHKN